MHDPLHPIEPGQPIDPPAIQPASRRKFLLLSLGVLAGCASGSRSGSLPGPVWTGADIDSTYPMPKPGPQQPSSPTIAGVIPRSRWAGGNPVPTLMRRLDPPRYITVHHDGMTVFRATDERSAISRLELIRTSHRNKDWGDIGYHFAIDPAGRVWEGRPLQYQGAHVKDYNESNIGIVCLGNFDQQSPSSQQLGAVNRHVSTLMRQFRISSGNVRTHQEWPSNTACPGRNLQRYMVDARKRGQLG